jgi:hypothetical protein
LSSPKKKGKLIWIGEIGQKRPKNQFFKKLGKEGCKKILAIAMDVSYEFSVKNTALRLR